jgi:nucleotide-binding universal stress UspA family protein
MIASQGPVVVGFDDSPAAESAVDWAAIEAVHRDRTLIVLYASRLPGLNRPEVTVGGHSEELERLAQAIAEVGVARAEAADPEVRAEPMPISTSAAAALTEASTKASLLVLGGRARSGLSDTLLGTVQLSVAAHAQCPVVVVPPGYDYEADSAHPVVVGVDGSDGSIRAAQVAGEAASRRNARLSVVAAWRTPPVEQWSRFNVVDEQWHREMRAAARAAAAESVATAVDLVTAQYPTVEVDEVVAEGRPSVVLAQESTGAGLLVVGSRGRGDLASLLLGSVGRNLIHLAECPLEIVR